jgi:transcriptional regulator with XRE-family HTH domain
MDLPTMTTPRKLARAIKKHNRKQHKIADELGVNVRYVNDWMKRGIEPTSPRIRALMGFPKIRKKHDGRSGFHQLPEHVQWWRKLEKGERDRWIQQNFQRAQ